MKTIVAAVNFSKSSLHAANYAADMCRTMGKDLVLVHIWNVPFNFNEIPELPGNIQKLKEATTIKLNELKLDLLKRTDARIKITCRMEDGEIIPALKQCSDSLKPYLVVMGQEEDNTLERFLAKARTISAMRHLGWPLMIVPAQASFKNIRNIGLACDLENVASSIPVREITNLVKEFHAQLHVIHVSTETGPVSNEKINESISLKFMLKELSPHYHLLKNKDFEKITEKFAENYKLDMLIVIPRKHDLADKIFRHSRSKKLVLHMGIPVMAIHE